MTDSFFVAIFISLLRVEFSFIIKYGRSNYHCRNEQHCGDNRCFLFTDFSSSIFFQINTSV